MTVREIVGEAVRYHGIVTEKKELDDYVVKVSSAPGSGRNTVPLPARVFPARGSGSASRAPLAMNPEFIVCDEPVSALDVSIQAGAQRTARPAGRTRADLPVHHAQLSVVKFISDRIAIMYLGKIVEWRGKDEVFAHRCIRTRRRSSAIRSPIRRTGDCASCWKAICLRREPAPGVPFHTRCRHATARCAEQEPPFRDQAAAMGGLFPVRKIKAGRYLFAASRATKRRRMKSVQ
jgi:ABC-type dipeptide/oligopeptide/nickel transport system ATPase component